MSCVICHVSCVMCHKSGVTNHVSRVRYQVSSVIFKQFHSQIVWAGELKFWQNVHLIQPVPCHVSLVMCHKSHVTCHLQNTFTAKQLEQGSWNFLQKVHLPNLLHAMCQVLCVMCNGSYVMCHVSCVTCHKSNVTCHVSSWKHHHGQTVRARDLKLWQKLNLPQFFTCYMSCVMCLLLHVTSRLSQVTCHMSSSKYLNSQTVRAEELKFLQKVHLS